MTLRFVACVEAGRLEGEALLLCDSIRRFGGAHAASPISAYRPREGEPLSAPTRDRLLALDVELIEDPLNQEHAYYPLANKVYAAAHAESTTEQETIVVCDSDAVFLSEPSELVLAPGIVAAAAPVGRVGDGSTGPGHDNDPYWERLYELAGVSERPFTETALRGRRIRAYWNTGLVALRRDAGLGQQWLDVLKTLIAERHFPERGIDHVEQLAFAAALARRAGEVAKLSPAYNYRITRRDRLRGPAAELDLPDIAHVHYMRSFHVRGFLETLEPPLDRESEQFRWLGERLPLEPEIVLSAADSGPIWKRIRNAAEGQLERRSFDAGPEE